MRYLLLLLVVALASSLSLTSCSSTGGFVWELGAPKHQREGQVGITFTERGVTKSAVSSSAGGRVAADLVALDDERDGTADR